MVICLSVALVRCVGDEPDTTGDGGADGSTNDVVTGDGSTGGGDGSSQNDGSSADAGDSGTSDSCVGRTDCPNNIEGANLQLWLRGNIGASCIGGRLSKWSDQSGKGNDAHSGTYQGGGAALAPQCGVAVLNMQSVVTFTAPAEPDGGDAGEYTQYVDETLGVNMNFVAFSDYTFFVVHRRAVNGAFGLVGQDLTVVPGGIASSCFLFMGISSPQDALRLDYQPLGDGGQGLAFAQHCSGGYGFLNTYVSATPVVDELVYSSSLGHRLYTNGVNVYVGGGGADDLVSVSDAGRPGIIGRGYNRYTTGTRYHGDIAEIIGYNTALSDLERGQIEGYLKRQWAITF